ncbi:MAG TPA: Zn-dependent hydrolase [Phycisphaerae bacterium]|nr:Zn-dependent hydrolase [Phycisphaerae bacterium]
MRYPYALHRLLATSIGSIMLLQTGLGCAAKGGAPQLSMADRVRQYATVTLTSDLRGVTPSERRMIPLLIEASEQMDQLFWLESYGDKAELLRWISNADTRRFVEINCGPWDRLNENKPFLPGIGPKPDGANFYPHDMTKREFEDHIAQNPADEKAFKNEYTVIRRDKTGRLIAIPYHEAFAAQTQTAAAKLREAAALADDPAMKTYLNLRAEALLTDNYRDSDLAWLDVKNNNIDCTIGPIEHYEDGLFGYKTSHGAGVMIKDRQWSQRLDRYTALLPGLQRGLPVPDAYKTETPGNASDLGAYDAVFCAGDNNAGPKGIAVNLPNDETIQLTKGARRMQFKNIIRAKFENILSPIADKMISPDQRQHVTFDAFFEDVMFHEVAHGLGIKNTVNGKGPVRVALREQFAALEESKADMVGLHMIAELRRQGQLTDGELLDNYVTYLADTSRLVRFGATDAYGQTTAMVFNFLKERGAFTRDAKSGTYRVDLDKAPAAVDALVAKLITLQGDGDYEGTKSFMAKMGKLDKQLDADLERIRKADIPVDLVFEQGTSVLFPK